MKQWSDERIIQSRETALVPLVLWMNEYQIKMRCIKQKSWILFMSILTNYERSGLYSTFEGGNLPLVLYCERKPINSFHVLFLSRLTLCKWLRWLTTVFPRLSSARCDSPPHVSICRACKDDASNLNDYQKPLQHLKGVKSLWYM